MIFNPVVSGGGVETRNIVINEGGTQPSSVTIYYTDDTMSQQTTYNPGFQELTVKAATGTMIVAQGTESINTSPFGSGVSLIHSSYLRGDDARYFVGVVDKE